MASCITFLAGSASQPPEPQKTLQVFAARTFHTDTIQKITDILSGLLITLEEALSLTSRRSLAQLSFNHDDFFGIVFHRRLRSELSIVHPVESGEARESGSFGGLCVR